MSQNQTSRATCSEEIRASQWECAWGEYVAALTERDEAFPARHTRGNRRPYKTACARVSRSMRALEKLGAKFTALGELVTVSA